MLSVGMFGRLLLYALGAALLVQAVVVGASRGWFVSVGSEAGPVEHAHYALCGIAAVVFARASMRSSIGDALALAAYGAALGVVREADAFLDHYAFRGAYKIPARYSVCSRWHGPIARALRCATSSVVGSIRRVSQLRRAVCSSCCCTRRSSARKSFGKPSWVWLTSAQSRTLPKSCTNCSAISSFSLVRSNPIFSSCGSAVGDDGRARAPASTVRRPGHRAPASHDKNGCSNELAKSCAERDGLTNRSHSPGEGRLPSPAYALGSSSQRARATMIISHRITPCKATKEMILR